MRHGRVQYLKSEPNGRRFYLGRIVLKYNIYISIVILWSFVMFDSRTFWELGCKQPSGADQIKFEVYTMRRMDGSGPDNARFIPSIHSILVVKTQFVNIAWKVY